MSACFSKRGLLLLVELAVADGATGRCIVDDVAPSFEILCSARRKSKL